MHKALHKATMGPKIDKVKFHDASRNPFEIELAKQEALPLAFGAHFKLCGDSELGFPDASLDPFWNCF